MLRQLIQTILAAVALLCTAAPIALAAKPDAKAANAFFEQRIRPVLIAHCYECHSVQSKIVQANLYLDSREGMRRGGDSGPTIVPGKVDEGTLIEALKYASLEMPPKGRLPDAVIADFEKWIELGALDPRDGKAPSLKVVDLEAGRHFWAYQPLGKVMIPAVKDTTWARNDIDRLVLAAMETAGLNPTHDADRSTFVRRIYFDLTGLPPTLTELDEFLADRSPRAIEQLVDTLLASPRFGERWGRHWLDVARYAESSGKERNVPYRMAWRYRDYVIDAFNADMPYDQFVREQIAGDLLDATSTADRDRQRIATGFLMIGPRPLTERVPEKYLLDVADEQLDVTCRAFLATTAACARCHDHKFDPIPTTDYYALIGIFRSTDELCGVSSLRREFSYARAASLGDEAHQKGAAKALQDTIRAGETELDRLNSAQRTATKNKDTQALADVKRQLAEATERLNEARARAETDAPDSLRFAMAARDREAPADYAVRIRGEVDDLGPVVPRGFLSVLNKQQSPAIERQASGRRELAEWIASAGNPLTARVMVNRVWHHLFGRGLVTSIDDFGSMGERPSHPELLDHLARRFIEQGWSVKRLIRELVLSRTYGQASVRSAESSQAASTIDPENRLLSRFTRRRLEAEAIRDAMLAASGELILTRPYGSATLKLVNIELGSSARSLAADDSARYRSVYLPLLRGNVPEMLSLFDFADPSLVVGARETTTVATQSLYLMNSKFVTERARRFAERLKQAESDAAARVHMAYRLAFARPPSEIELRQVLEFIARGKQGDAQNPASADVEVWTDFCQTLLGSAEFMYLR